MINKFQQGGKQQQALMQFVQQLAGVLQADPQQVVQAAQQNPQALEAAVQTYQQTQDMNQAAQAFSQTLQQGAQKAAHGAKLNYIKKISHKCADDEELVYYRKGGSVDCGCVKKNEDGGKATPKKENPVNKFKESKKKEGWDKNGNYIVSKKKIEERKKQLNANKTKEETTPPNINKGIGKNCNGSKMKLVKKGGEVCPKCGKVHKAGIGCSVAAFKEKFMNGGSIKIMA